MHGRSGRRAIDTLLRRLHGSASGDTVVVDLKPIRLIRPVHLVAAAARAHAAQRSGRPFRLLAPSDPAARSYAGRMRLGQVLDGFGAQHDVPEPASVRDRSADLLELSVIGSHSDVRRLSALVHNKVRTVDPRTADALHEALAEVGANVRDHADDIGFAAAQTMPTRRELRFAVADAGLGLLGTLARRGAQDDADATRLALDGVSRFDNPARGNGLKQTVELVTRLGGRVYLASGSASVVVSRSTRAEDGCAWGIRGTLVEATIPLTRPEFVGVP